MPDQVNRMQNLKSVALRITDQCNLDCKMCGQAKSRNKHNDGSVIPLSQLLPIIDELEPYRPQIYLWGGEPLLYKELHGFIEYVRSKSLNVFITTNGLLLNRFIPTLVDHKVTEIAVSVDGSADLHDAIRGRKGLYKQVFANLEKLKEYKEQAGSVFPLVDIHTVIIRENYRYLYDFVEEVNRKKLCRRIRIQLPMFFTVEMADRFTAYASELFSVHHARSWYEFVSDFSDIDTDALNDQLARIKRDFNNIIFFPKDVDIGVWFRQPEIAFRSRCELCAFRLNIEPNGDAVACTDFPETVYGNVLQTSITEVFNHSIINKHRENVDKELQGICPRCSSLNLFCSAN